MGILAERSRPLRKFSLGDKHNMVVRLILVNIIIFAALTFVRVVYLITDAPKDQFVSQVIPWAVLPANGMQLLTHPWTIITYMFVHIDFWLLLSSLVWFWGYGELLQGLYGYQHILPLYLLGGLAGALFFILSFQFVPVLEPLQSTANSIHVGASASVMAIIICVTILVPKYRVFPMLAGGIPIFIITLIYIGLSFLGQKGILSDGYLAAQAGGALIGIFYGYRIKKGFNPGEGINHVFYRISHIFEPKDTLTAIPVEHIKRKKHSRKKSLPPYKRIGPVSQNKVDELLDKISRTGYKSLTSEEKEILVRASKEENDNKPVS